MQGLYQWEIYLLTLFPPFFFLSLFSFPSSSYLLFSPHGAPVQLNPFGDTTLSHR